MFFLSGVLLWYLALLSLCFQTLFFSLFFLPFCISLLSMLCFTHFLFLFLSKSSYSLSCSLLPVALPLLPLFCPFMSWSLSISLLTFFSVFFCYRCSLFFLHHSCNFSFFILTPSASPLPSPSHFSVVSSDQFHSSYWLCFTSLTPPQYYSPPSFVSPFLCCPMFWTCKLHTSKFLATSLYSTRQSNFPFFCPNSVWKS